MTSRECFENKWFYMKYIGKYLSGEILLAHECTCCLMLSSVGLKKQSLCGGEENQKTNK
jgi:hypothetical protein